MSISEKAVEAAARALAEHDDPDTSWGELTLYWHEHYCAEARVVLKAALPLHQHAAPGWKLVPEDPTHAMKQAGYCAWLRADKTQVYGEAIFDRAYVAALAAAPPAPVQEDLDRREIACLRAAVTDAGAYIALCPPPPEATGSLRIELLERRERIGKAAALIAEKDPKP